MLMQGVASMRVAGKRPLYLAVAFVMLYSIIAGAPFGFSPPKAEAAISLRSSTTNSSAPCNSGLTINKPAGVTVGDVMLAQIASDGGALSTPSGWATIDNGSYHSGSIRMATFYRIIEGGEDANFTFPVNTSTSCRGGIIAFEGVDNGQVIDNPSTGHTANSGSGTTISAPQVNTVNANTVLVVSMYKAGGSGSGNFSTVSGMTERYDFGDTNGAIGSDYVTQAAAAPSGAKTSTISSANWAVHMVALKPATVHMMLFWDGASAPAGWSFVTEAEGKYLRGESPANYGLTGGQATHSHSGSATVTMGPPSALVGQLLALATAAANAGHTHAVPSATASSSTASNEPSGYKLRLIRFNSGVPNIIPADAIALFDGDPGMPNDGHWTQLSAANSRVIKVDSSVGNGPGSDTHTHTINWGSIGAITSSNQNACTINLFGCTGTVVGAAPTNHTHSLGSTSTSAAATAIPPYFQPVLGKVDAATPTLSLGLTAMFNGEPGGGWIVKSDNGGDYYHKFIRPGSTFISDGGADGHKIPDSQITSGPATGSVDGNAGNAAAAAGHTHTFTAVWPAYTTDPSYISNDEYFLPQYFSIVIAEKVNFILDAYRWYDDTNNIDVTDPWSAMDPPENEPILAIPTAYNPPVVGTELRLRVRIAVNNNDLAAGEMQFKLQFKEGTDGSCTTGVWTDLDSSSGGGTWRYAASSVSPPYHLTTSVMGSDVLQLYVNTPSSGTNPNPVTAGEKMEWDFHIQNNGATGATRYSFRVVEDSGLLLSQYGPEANDPKCPTLVTKPDTNNQMRHGNFFESGVEQGYSWVD